MATGDPTEYVERVGGGDLHYWVYGTNPDAGERTSEQDRLVVMIHGLRGTHHGLELVVEHCGADRVVVPDLPGFGASGPVPGAVHDVAGYARIMIELLELLGARRRPVVLLGHSFGSLVAAHLVSLDSDLVWRLVLVNPIATPALRGPRAVLSRLTSAYYRLGRKLPRRLGHALLSNKAIVLAVSRAMVRSKDSRTRRFVHDSHLRHFSRFHSPQLLYETYEASVSHTVSDYAAALTVPTLLIAGAADDIAPVDGQHRLAEQLSDAELVVIPGVGHLVHYETPVTAGRAIHRFLGESRV